MNKESVEIIYLCKRIVPSFGTQNIEVDYMMHHVKYGRVNKYLVTCRVEGLEVHDPEIMSQSATRQGNMENDSNDETLTEEAAINLFDNNI